MCPSALCSNVKGYTSLFVKQQVAFAGYDSCIRSVIFIFATSRYFIQLQNLSREPISQDAVVPVGWQLEATLANTSKRRALNLPLSERNRRRDVTGTSDGLKGRSPGSAWTS